MRDRLLENLIKLLQRENYQKEKKTTRRFNKISYFILYILFCIYNKTTV